MTACTRLEILLANHKGLERQLNYGPCEVKLKKKRKKEKEKEGPSKPSILCRVDPKLSNIDIRKSPVQ